LKVVQVVGENEDVMLNAKETIELSTSGTSQLLFFYCKFIEAS
jgi:hypothetical protein